MKFSSDGKTKLVLVIASVFTGILLMVSMLVVQIVVDPIPPGASIVARVLWSLGGGLASAGLLGSFEFGSKKGEIGVTAGGGFGLFALLYLVEPGIFGLIHQAS